jgi:LCP family protein required for cell wall assembly
LIIIALPLTMVGWAASIFVPVAIEAQRAAGKVFVTPVQREHFVTPSTGPETVTTEQLADPTSSVPTATDVASPNAGEAIASPDVPTSTPYPPWDGQRPINILLLGVDTRESDSAPPRSDTMIVVRIDPVQKRVDMLSIPRDLLVDIPGFYQTKINAAYPFGEASSSVPGGGPTLAAQTVEQNFGIYIDYFAEVDIQGMEKVIDTLDGIIIDVPGVVKDDQYPTADYGYTRVYFTPGLQLMDGQTAVRYSRTRHDDGDFARQDRQQEVLMAIRDRALATGIISKLPELISEVGDSVRTDLSLRQVLSLARLGQDIDSSNIYSHSLLPYVQDQYIDGGYYLIGDWAGIQALAQDLPDDPNARNAFDSSQNQNVATPEASPTSGP